MMHAKERRMSMPPVGPTGSNRFISVRPEWLSGWREEILEPELPIVDPHHHLWHTPASRYLLDELLEDVNSGHNIVATVFLQCGAMYRADGPEAMRPVGETEFVNGVAAMSASGRYGPSQICAGIVGHADLRLGAAVQEVLDAHLRTAGDRFRGIRHGSAWDDDVSLQAPVNQIAPGLLDDPKVREGFARLAPLGLSFDAWMYHPQIGELTDLARAFPETRIVLDHVGAPLGVARYAGRRDQVFASWSSSIKALASCPNAFVKLGGLGMKMFGFDFHERAAPPSSEELATAWRPYVETCIDAFGATRCMFESNFPVDKGSAPYAAFWNAFKRLASGAGAGEKRELFSGTAARFYRLTLPM
jgi:L-fuconolactonase